MRPLLITAVLLFTTACAETTEGMDCHTSVRGIGIYDDTLGFSPADLEWDTEGLHLWMASDDIGHNIAMSLDLDVEAQFADLYNSVLMPGVCLNELRMPVIGHLTTEDGRLDALFRSTIRAWPEGGSWRATIDDALTKEAWTEDLGATASDRLDVHVLLGGSSPQGSLILVRADSDVPDHLLLEW